MKWNWIELTVNTRPIEQWKTSSKNTSQRICCSQKISSLKTCIDRNAYLKINLGLMVCTCYVLAGENRCFWLRCSFYFTTTFLSFFSELHFTKGVDHFTIFSPPATDHHFFFHVWFLSFFSVHLACRCYIIHNLIGVVTEFSTIVSWIAPFQKEKKCNVITAMQYIGIHYTHQCLLGCSGLLALKIFSSRHIKVYGAKKSTKKSMCNTVISDGIFRNTQANQVELMCGIHLTPLRSCYTSLPSLNIWITC